MPPHAKPGLQEGSAYNLADAKVRPRSKRYLACRAKISMRLSSKPSDGLGLRKISSVRSGVASPEGGLASPSQPESQKAMPPLGPSSPPVSLRFYTLSGLIIGSPSLRQQANAHMPCVA